MTKKTDTWMPLYVSAYLADTAHLSTEEHGAYMLLLMHAWVNNGDIPSDEERLRRITRMDAKAWKASRLELLAFFYVDESGNLRHRRVDTELQRANKLTTQRIEAGKASANRRKEERKGQQTGNETATTVATTVDSPLQRNGRPIPIPIPIPIPSEPKGSADKSAVKPPVDMAKSQLWKAAVSLLGQQGMAEPQARTFIGKLSKTYPDSDIVLKAVEGAVSEQPADARAYLRATCQRLNGERKSDGSADWTRNAI